MVQPVIGSVALVWTLAGYAIFFGIMLILLGFRLKGWNGPNVGRNNRNSGGLQPL
jgi:hypothetical protein